MLAQIGSFIPAEASEIRLTDSLFTRVGSDDDMESNASTYFVEMRETAAILDGVGHRSLVIIDELGRGTSNEDGVALAFAVSEALAAQGGLTFFATHYDEITWLSAFHFFCLPAATTHPADRSSPCDTFMYR